MRDGQGDRMVRMENWVVGLRSENGSLPCQCACVLASVSVILTGLQRWLQSPSAACIHGCCSHLIVHHASLSKEDSFDRLQSSRDSASEANHVPEAAPFLFPLPFCGVNTIDW